MGVSVTIKCRGCQRHRFCRTVQKDEVKAGDYCVVETKRGVFLGQVRQDVPSVKDKAATKSSARVIRKARPEDIEKAKRNRQLEEKAFDFCLQRIEVRKLEMKLVGVECLLEGNKAIFYFTADGRVDFRDLVRDLAHELRTRIEMKQVGVRDETKMLGGYGGCGLSLCCASFLEDFKPVSIRMAKVQRLTLDPAKISGVCGRLMCCLEYEHQSYEKMRKAMPRVGERVTVQGETGKVKYLDMLTGVVSVSFGEGKIVKYSLEELKENTSKSKQ